MKFKNSPAVLLLVSGAFLMFVDTLLAWQSVDVGSDTYSRNAWHGFWGVVLGLLAIAFLANTAGQAGVVELKLRLPHRYLSVLLAPAILVFAVIKNIDDKNSAWASYAGIVLGVLVTLAALNAWKAKPEAEKAAAPPPAPVQSSAPPSDALPADAPPPPPRAS
jgi:hypothetical protein